MFTFIKNTSSNNVEVKSKNDWKIFNLPISIRKDIKNLLEDNIELLNKELEKWDIKSYDNLILWLNKIISDKLTLDI